MGLGGHKADKTAEPRCCPKTSGKTKIKWGMFRSKEALGDARVEQGHR